ncbi:MAG: NepR family anti-sigma factor [Oceanicaulis sp.]
MNKKPEDDNKTPSPSDAASARERQRLIGRRLQSLFDDTIQQGVPVEFEKLLSQLDETEAERKGGKADGAARKGAGSSS